MPERQDTMRQPTRLHVRKNARKAVRGHATMPHEIWGDNYAGGDTAPAATTAFAGLPGDFGPVGCTTPANAAAVGTLAARPTTAWTTGQYVQSATAGLTGRAYWNGTAWVTGAIAP